MAAREGALRSPGPVPQLQIIKVQCELCKVKINATSYKRHMKTQHDLGQVKKWQCRLCLKILESKARLNGHEKSHNNQAKEKEFQCDKCIYATIFYLFLVILQSLHPQLITSTFLSHVHTDNYI